MPCGQLAQLATFDAPPTGLGARAGVFNVAVVVLAPDAAAPPPFPLRDRVLVVLVPALVVLVPALDVLPARVVPIVVENAAGVEFVASRRTWSE